MDSLPPYSIHHWRQWIGMHNPSNPHCSHYWKFYHNQLAVARTMKLNFQWLSGWYPRQLLQLKMPNNYLHAHHIIIYTHYMINKKTLANHIHMHSHVYMHAICTVPHKHRGYSRIHAMKWRSIYPIHDIIIERERELHTTWTLVLDWSNSSFLSPIHRLGQIHHISITEVSGGPSCFGRSRFQS